MTGAYRYIYKLHFLSDQKDGKTAMTIRRLVEISVVANTPREANGKAENVRIELFGAQAYPVLEWTMKLEKIIERAVEVNGATNNP